MKFSVIVACRNAERFIGRCLQSLVDQQSENVQVQAIVVDGASTDGTFNIVRSFEGKFDELIATSEPDTGIYNAMNKGLAKATGDVVSILNSDDWLLPETMERAAKELAKEGTDYVYGTAGQSSRDGASPRARALGEGDLVADAASACDPFRQTERLRPPRRLRRELPHRW